MLRLHEVAERRFVDGPQTRDESRIIRHVAFLYARRGSEGAPTANPP